jgi:hypothetical protein
MKILKAKMIRLNWIQRIKERGIFHPKNKINIKYKTEITVTNFDKLDAFKADIQSMRNSFIDIMKHSDSEVKIKLEFYNKKKMNQLMNKHF